MNKHILSIIFFLLLICTPAVAQDFWEPLIHPDTCAITSIEITPDGDIYLGMGGNGMPGGVYRSQDEAQNWEFLGYNNLTFYDLETCSNGDIIGGSGLGVYKYKPESNVWTNVYPNLWCGTIKASKDSLVFANWHTLPTTQAGIMRSLDYGETWDSVFVFTHKGEEHLRALEFSPEGHIYAGTRNPFGESGVYRSTDRGESWEEFWIPEFHLPVMSITFSPSGELYVGTLGDGLYKYNFDDQQWTHIFYNSTPNTMFFVSDDTIYAGLDSNPNFNGGFVISEDGGINWAYNNSGFGGGNVKELVLHPNGYLYAQNGSFLYKSTELINVSIFETEIAQSSSAFPNPFSSQTQIVWDQTNLFEETKIIITNFQGEIIEQSAVQGKNIYVFDGSNHQAGIYFYTLQQKEKMLTGKMVIM